MNSSERELGSVKFFNRTAGYGFIKCDNASDLFFHVTECSNGHPSQEDRVEFTVGEGKKGPCAKDINILK